MREYNYNKNPQISNNTPNINISNEENRELIEELREYLTIENECSYSLNTTHTNNNIIKTVNLINKLLLIK